MKSLLQTINEQLEVSNAIFKELDVVPPQAAPLIPGLLDKQIELSHMFREFKLSEQRVANGTQNEMEPGARYIRQLNKTKLANIDESFIQKYSNLGYASLAEVYSLDELLEKLSSLESGLSENQDASDVDSDTLTEGLVDEEPINLSEEVDSAYLEEKLTAANPASEWIADFVKSDDPKFAGKSKKERISMALGAYYAAKKAMDEEVEQVDDAFAVLEGQTPAERLRWAGARRIARQLIPGAGKLQAHIRAKDERDQAYYAGQEYAADGGKRGPTKPGDDYGDTNTMANRHHKRADRWRKIAQGQPPFKEEVEQVDEEIKPYVSKMGKNWQVLDHEGKVRFSSEDRDAAREHVKTNYEKYRDPKYAKKETNHDEVNEMVKPSTYENIIRAAAQAHKDGRKGAVKNILFDADSAVDLMTGANVKIPAKAKAMHDKLNKMYPAKPWKVSEEAEQIDEIKMKTAIRALHSMKDKADDYYASPEDTKRVNRMSNAIARKWGEKGAAVADKAVSDIDAKQARKYNTDSGDALGRRDQPKVVAADVMQGGARKGKLRPQVMNLKKHYEKAKLADIRRIKTPNLPEEVEQIDEESAHLTVTKLKSNGEYEQAGAAAFKHRLGRKYGPHFGLRSTKDKDEAAFHLGYDKAEMQSRKKVDEEVEQISGSVLSKLRAARAK